MTDRKMREYQRRIEELERLIIENQLNDMHMTKLKSEEEQLFEQAKFLVSQALDAEEDPVGVDEEAVRLYTEAVQLCLTAKASPKIDELMANQIAKLASQALDRAEKLKGITTTGSKGGAGQQFSPWPAPHVTSSSSSGGPPPQESAHGSDIPQTVTGKSYYSDDEKKVLLFTSKINRIDYLPFMDVDLREKFATHLPFSDHNGYLQLSPKQAKNFFRWARPDEIWSSPKMIERIDCFSIKQTVISDCSFVASLSVSALYEKKFKKKLITSIIYPMNKAGDPVYNPCGKYMVKLLLNGVPRKIIIDDYLPVGKNGELLCSYSNNKGELWVSLLEKAYMKVMGGYDFPGSNSNIDLHALTGWIPERLSIHSTEHAPFEKNKTFLKLQDRMARGDVLVTVATGNLTDKEATRAGLVPTHAYAVLDIREVKGVRLLLVKNPWSHLRWKGNYSELDALHWTDEMKRLLNYDPSCASMFDNGVFWIDYDSICKFFDVIYMNWNPADLRTKNYKATNKYKIGFHKNGHKFITWSAGVGPAKDVYNISENPQYRLEIKSSSPDGAAVWVLLTRHITEIEDFKENREYITVVVYDTDGKRVFYPYEPPPMIDGVRINSPHYLCKIRVQGTTAKRFTLVISQYEKMKSIHYTLRAYSSCPFQMNEIPEVGKYQKQITGEWKGKSAGGCLNHPESYQNNPCYKIALKTSSNENTLIIELKGPKDFHVGFDILCSNVTDPKAPGFFNKKSCGNYRPGFVVLQIDHVPSGVYHIIPTTFKPGSESPFFLKVESSCDFSMDKL
ncbi:Calpain-7 [Folsomia candida]|uniref:Calpain-7 n=1 Tax=Folsomia candida TaxID=158441 RepID=A0A226E398_FOLCA|nr:Calpain-7 [Folsomia candida]